MRSAIFLETWPDFKHLVQICHCESELGNGPRRNSARKLGIHIRALIDSSSGKTKEQRLLWQNHPKSNGNIVAAILTCGGVIGEAWSRSIKLMATKSTRKCNISYNEELREINTDLMMSLIKSRVQSIRSNEAV